MSIVVEVSIMRECTQCTLKRDGKGNTEISSAIVKVYNNLNNTHTTQSIHRPTIGFAR